MSPAVTITGTPGADTLNGTPNDDVIHGRGGNDVIKGRGGNDVICGGWGDDKLNGGDGDDILIDVPVSIVDLVLGTKVEVPTLDGKVALKILNLGPERIECGCAYRFAEFGLDGGPDVVGRCIGGQIVGGEPAQQFFDLGQFGFECRFVSHEPAPDGCGFVGGLVGCRS